MGELRIACIGEAMLELIIDAVPGAAQVGVAGDVLNTAIYLRRLLPGSASVCFVSNLGADNLSDGMIRFIADQNLDTSLIGRLEDRLPGLYSISTDEKGERTFEYWRKNSAATRLFQTAAGAPFDMLEGFDVVYLSAITLAILQPETRHGLLDWLDGFRARGGKFAFDSNYRPQLWQSREVAREVIEAAWLRCDIALPSADDEIALFGDISDAGVLERFRAYSRCGGALKRGHLGPASINIPVEPMTFKPAPAVVDTTAAGDSFNAGYLAARLTGKSQSEALASGHRLASKIIGHRGAIMPAGA